MGVTVFINKSVRWRIGQPGSTGMMVTGKVRNGLIKLADPLILLMILLIALIPDPLIPVVFLDRRHLLAKAGDRGADKALE